MPATDHPYFGRLDSDTGDGVVWEGLLNMNGQQSRIALWTAPGQTFDSAELDSFAKQIERLEALDADARAALRSFLETDGAYIAHHREQLPKGGSLPESADAFVRAMRLTDIGLLTRAFAADENGANDDGDDGYIILDYMIAPEESGEILAVSCDRQGRVISIDWES